MSVVPSVEPSDDVINRGDRLGKFDYLFTTVAIQSERCYDTVREIRNDPVHFGKLCSNFKFVIAR